MRAKIHAENAKLRATEIVCSILGTTPALLHFLTPDPEVISFLTEKVEWFQALRMLQRRNCWVVIAPESPEYNAIQQLKLLYPDVVTVEP